MVSETKPYRYFNTCRNLKMHTFHNDTNDSVTFAGAGLQDLILLSASTSYEQGHVPWNTVGRSQGQKDEIVCIFCIPNVVLMT